MPLAALGGCPPVGLSPEAAGKGRKAPYGVLQREPPLSTLYLLEALGESLGEKTPFHRLVPLLSRLSHGGRLGRP